VSAVTTEPQAPLLECRDLVVGYEPGRPVINGVDLAINKGEIVALLGGSGCGKSTLLKSITGLLKPISGQVKLFGESLYDLDEEDRGQLMRRAGFLFQADALFGSISVVDNVALPLRELTRLPAPVIREMARMRLAMVGLAGFENRPPESLSGGQRKRAALARASILDPELIFCDEPSAGLDPIVAAGLDETLVNFKTVYGMTIVAVTHELESIRTIADRAVYLGGGRILATGTIDELSESDDEEVHNFFHRVAVDNASDAGDAVDQLRHGS
jgi:phospholipid/cholesterol/gamma-HCH transport system ATP-binding protein